MLKSLSDEKEKFQLLHSKESTYLNKLIERNKELLEYKKTVEDNEKVLLSTNEQLLLDKKMLEDKILGLEVKLELTESAKKKLEEKNRNIIENKVSPSSSYDTELALRAELAELRQTKSVLVNSIKSISSDDLTVVQQSLSPKSTTSYDIYEDDDDQPFVQLSSLVHIKSSPISVNDELVENESVLKYITESQKLNNNSRPAKNQSFSTYFNSSLESEKTKTSFKANPEPVVNDTSDSILIASAVSAVTGSKYSSPIVPLSSSLSTSIDTPSKSIPSSKTSTPTTLQNIKTPMSSRLSSNSLVSLDSVSTTSSKKSSLSSSSSKKSMNSTIGKTKDNISDRFILPPSKLELLLAPAEVATTTQSLNTGSSKNITNSNYSGSKPSSKAKYPRPK